MELNEQNIRRIRGLIVFTAAAAACVWRTEEVLAVLGFLFHVALPFLLGGAIAFVLNVPMDFVERHLFAEKKRDKGTLSGKLARPVSMLIVVSGMLGAVGLVIFVLIPQLGRTFANLGQSIREFLPRVQEWADRISQGNVGNLEITEMLERYEPDWGKIMDAGAGDMLDSTLAAARSIVSSIAVFVIAFVFAVYLLLQKEKLRLQAKKVLFAFVRRGRAEAALEVLSLTYETFSGFLTGQCLEAAILGTMFAVSMWLFRLPYALLVGLVTAFTALVPIFGAFVGCAVGTFLIFMTDPMKALFFVILFLVLQQIEGNLIYPHVVGSSVGLPSIWVLAAVSLGASLMGVVGMLVFIPIVSVVYALFREIVYLKLRQRGVRPEEIE